MHTREAVVAVDDQGLDRLALTFGGERSPALDSDVDLRQVLDTHKLVESKLAILHLGLIVLLDAGRVDALHRDAER